MCSEMMRQFLLLITLFTFGITSAHAQTCTVTPPSSFNLGSVDVLTNSIMDVQTSININCSVMAGQEVRLCISMGDPNGENGSTRYLVNGTNKLYYDVFSDPGRTRRWGSWLNGVGSGHELVFTPSTSTYSTSVPIYARVFSGQQMTPTQNPSLIYTSTFTRNITNLYQHAQYTATGLDCSQLTAGGSAWAVPMTITASVLHKCIVSGGALNFGIVSSLNNRIDASTNISLICSNTLPYSIALDNGLNSASSTTRKMKSGSNTVDYSLFRDAGRTRNWGATIGVDTLGGVGTAVTTSIPIYGRVPAQSTPPAATYTDTVQITVTY